MIELYINLGLIKHFSIIGSKLTYSTCLLFVKCYELYCFFKKRLKMSNFNISIYKSVQCRVNEYCVYYFV